MSDNSNVSFGPSSIVGFAAAAASAVVPIVGELADASAPLGVDPRVWVIVSAVLACVTVIGRMWQAAAAAGSATFTTTTTYTDQPVLDVDAPDIGDADPVDLDGNPVDADPQG